MSFTPHLFTVGRQARGRGTLPALRATVLALGSFLLAVAAMLAVIAVETSGLAADRSQSIRPVLAEGTDEGTVLYSFAGFDALSDEPITVILLDPLTPDAPTPPGVTTWPEPGHVAVSPALAEMLHGDLTERFGPVDSHIGPEGIETPTERRVYIRAAHPLDPDAPDIVRITKFGSDSAAMYGFGTGSLYSAPLFQVLMLITVALALPAISCVILASVAQNSAEQRRETVLSTLGADRRRSVLIGLGMHGIPLAVGFLLASAAGTAALFTGIRIRPLDAWYPASGLRPMAPALGIACLVAVLVATFVVLATRELGRRYRVRDISGLDDALPMRRAAAAPLALIAVVWLTSQVAAPMLRTSLYIGGSIVVAVLLPAAVAVTLHFCGYGCATLGRRLSSPGLLLGGRRLQRFPTRTSRLTAGVVFAIVIAGQVHLFASMLGASYYAAQETQRTYGTTLVSAETSPQTPGVATFVDDIADSPGVAAVWTINTFTDDGSFGTEFVMACPAAAALELDCASPAEGMTHPAPGSILDRLIHATPSTSVRATISEDLPSSGDDAEGYALYLVSTDGSDLPLDALNQHAYTTVPGGLQLSTQGSNWAVAGENQRTRGDWTLVYGLIGTAAIAVAITCLVARDILDAGRLTIPLSATAGRRSWLYSHALIRTALPLSAAGVIGAATYYVLPTGMTIDSGLITGATYMKPSLTFAVAAAAIPTAIGLLVAGIIGASQQRFAAHWRPGGGA